MNSDISNTPFDIELAARWQAIYEATPIAITFWDETATMIDCNEACWKMFGYKSAEDLVKNWHKSAPKFQPDGTPSMEKVAETFDKTLKEGHFRHEFLQYTTTGEPVPLDVTHIYVKFKDSYMFVAYLQDLRPLRKADEKIRQTEQELKRIEIAEEESRAKTRFLARMSHEIRTPMNAVLGISEIQLQKSGHPLETEEAFLRIYNSSKLLLTIINDILDLSKVEAGKMDIVPVVYEMASLIVDTVQLNLMHIGSKKIDFELNIDENLPAYLIGDALRIKQILNNLLSNAFKYTHVGKVALSFGKEEETDGNIMLVISVKDTGQGMCKKQIDALFGIEFTRFNIQSNHAIEGSGLGMYIAHQLISLMGGNINVESTVGEGSTFTVYIPQKPLSNLMLGKKTAENLQNLELTQKALKRMKTLAATPMPYGKVLVVDDVDSNLYVAKGLMRPYKLHIETAQSGQEAISIIKSGKEYDIIFLDHMMPDMDGIETARVLRGMGYDRPIVAFTANALKGQMQMFLDNGFSGFISKPIDVNHLDSYLKRFILDKYGNTNHNTATDNLSDELTESFLRDARKAIDVLKPIAEKKSFNGNNLKDYITQTHAMKSALANVKEQELSEVASTLEQAGRQQNLEVIREETDYFLDRLWSIMDRYITDETEETIDEDPSFLHEQLQALQKACINYDIETANHILTELKTKRRSNKTKVLLGEIGAFLLHGDFEEAAVLAGRGE